MTAALLLPARPGARLPALLLALVVAGPLAAQPLPAAEAALLARIQGEIGSAACTADAQCRSLPLGHKACGGPAGYLAWSATQSRADRLQAWADELAALQRRRQSSEGRMSNCALEPDPGARCAAGRCTLRSPGTTTTGTTEKAR